MRSRLSPVGSRFGGMPSSHSITAYGAFRMPCPFLVGVHAVLLGLGIHDPVKLMLDPTRTTSCSPKAPEVASAPQLNLTIRK